MRFGIFLGQAGMTWDGLRERFELADELGYDHIWLVDHLMPTDPPHDREMLEAWTSLAALAALTTRVRIGILVTSNTFRHPSVLARQAMTVDHISRGRLILGVGTGWYEDEHRRFGIDFPDAPTRVDQLEEALDVITALMTGEPASVSGRHYHLREAQALPPPIQRPRVPILIAAHRPRMLRLAARRADMWDTFATTRGTATEGIESSLAERVRVFEQACGELGRDPMTVRRSVWVGTEPFESVDAYADFAERHRALGFTDLMATLPSPERWSIVREVATTLIPRLREASTGQERGG